MAIELLYYVEGDGSEPPLVEWLDNLEEEARSRCLDRMLLLEELGNKLRQPHTEYLGDGIYELRIKYYRTNLRILYFFHGRQAAVVSHGLSKEKRVPPKEIELAIERMKKFKANAKRHTFRRPSPQPPARE